MAILPSGTEFTTKIHNQGDWQVSRCYDKAIAEAVRIDLRGENVLNSKSEYSRCRFPRLVIDQEEWRINKKGEEGETGVGSDKRRDKYAGR